MLLSGRGLFILFLFTSDKQIFISKFWKKIPDKSQTLYWFEFN